MQTHKHFSRSTFYQTWHAGYGCERTGKLPKGSTKAITYKTNIFLWRLNALDCRRFRSAYPSSWAGKKSHTCQNALLQLRTITDPVTDYSTTLRTYQTALPIWWFCIQKVFQPLSASLIPKHQENLLVTLYDSYPSNHIFTR